MRSRSAGFGRARPPLATACSNLMNVGPDIARYFDVVGSTGRHPAAGVYRTSQTIRWPAVCGLSHDSPRVRCRRRQVTVAERQGDQRWGYARGDERCALVGGWGIGAMDCAPLAPPSAGSATVRTYEELIDMVIASLRGRRMLPDGEQSTPWDAFARLSERIHLNYHIPHTTVTPVMRRLLFALGAGRPRRAHRRCRNSRRLRLLVAAGRSP